MALRQAIIDAADTIAMVAYLGGDMQGQFIVEVTRVCDTEKIGKDACEKRILDLLINKYGLEVEL